MSSRDIALAGLSVADVLSFTADEMRALVVRDGPVVYRGDEGEVHARLAIENGTLAIALTRIVPGGEDLLPLIAALAHRHAAQERLQRVEWRVLPMDPQLRPVLDRRGFQVRTIAGAGTCWYLVEMIDADGHVRRPRALIAPQDYVVDVTSAEPSVLYVRHPATGKSVSRAIGAEPVDRHLPELLLELERALRPGPRPS